MSASLLPLNADRPKCSLAVLFRPRKLVWLGYKLRGLAELVLRQHARVGSMCGELPELNRRQVCARSAEEQHNEQQFNHVTY